MFRVLLVAVAAALTSACGAADGGPGNPGGPGDPVMMLMHATHDRTGIGVYAPGEAAFLETGPLAPLLIGDTEENAVVHGFLSFDLGAIPAGAEVLDATLEVGQLEVSGTPYVQLGSLLVDQVSLGATLDLGDVEAPVVSGSAIAVLATNAALGTKDASVATAVAEAVGKGHSFVDFRVRFALPSDLDFARDRAYLENPGNAVGTGNVPTLQVTWQ